MSFSLRSSVNRQMLWRTVGTLLVAVAAAWLCEWLRTPIPWMMGPLVAVAVLSVLGAPTESWVPFRNGGQWVIGSALGLYFTPAVGALVAGLWWAIVVGVAWACLLGWAFGRWLAHVHAQELAALTPAARRATTYFAGAIGGVNPTPWDYEARVSTTVPLLLAKMIF
ncbi:MAG: AbrB family transcriptional regulator [Burkholderiaceae bacterium]